MRLVLVTAWILAGAALTGGTYWGFLNTPESTIGTLALSAVLALIAVTLLSITINGAIVVWSNGSVGTRAEAHVQPHSIDHPRLARVRPVLVDRLPAGHVDCASHRRDQRLVHRALRLGRCVVVLHGRSFFTTWLRWVLGGLLAVSLMGGMAAIGWRAGARPQWVRRAMRPRALLAATLWFVVLIVLPWMYLVPWRPGWVPPTGAELAFIAGKLSIAAIAMAAGVALMIHEATRVPFTPIDPEAQRIAA